VFCASLGWVAVLRSQVKAQTKIISLKVQREAALEERTRIARDLHDDLGASLTHISFLSGVAQKERGNPQAVEEHLSEISGSAQEAFRALDEIVWVVNPKNDTVENLTNYICHFAAEFFRGTATRCRLDLPSSLPDCPIPTETRNNLFFAVKEALNNVRKHAQAAEVTVRFRMEARGAPVSLPPISEHQTGADENADAPKLSYCLSIEDNGRGFSLPKVTSNRNGLPNMRCRLEKIGGRFALESVPGQGTKVRLVVPL
jgi:signal transduction histidine kinase